MKVVTIADFRIVANLAAIHAKQVTFQVKDMRLVCEMHEIMLRYAWISDPSRDKGAQ